MSEVVLASQVTTSTVVWYGVEFETYKLVLKLSNLGSTPYGYRVVQYQNGIQVDILVVAPQTHAISSTTEVDLGTVTGRIGIYLNNDFGETVTIAVADSTPTAGGTYAQLSTIASIKPSNNTAVPAPAIIAADTTIVRAHNIPFTTKTFTVLLENYGAAPLVYDNVSVKVGGNGTTQCTAVRMTQGGSNTITVPAAKLPSTNGTDAKFAVPSVVELDLVITGDMDNETTSVPDTTMPIIVWLRMHTTSGGTFQKANSIGSDANIPDTAGTIAGDKVTTWDSTVITYSPTNAISVSAIRARTSKPSISIMYLGDSHMTGNLYPESFGAMLAADFPGVNFSYFKQAAGGVPVATMLAWCDAYLAVVKPDIVYAPGVSVNDGASGVYTSRTKSMTIINQCLEAGCAVVTSNQTPYDGQSGAWLTRVTKINADIPLQNKYWYDQWTDYADPATGAFLPGLSSDGIHFNATGQAQVKPIAYAAFKAAVASLVGAV